jgi:hypothetical protein
MHRFKFEPDDLFINRLKTYPEYNVFIYQEQMFVNSESRPSGSGGMVVYDINRNLTGSNMVRPFVETDSTKPVFKSKVFQPIVKTVDAGPAGHFYKRKYAALDKLTAYPPFQELEGQYSFETPITRNLTDAVTSHVVDYWDASRMRIYNRTVQLNSPLNLSASALQNVCRKYTTLSNHFELSSSYLQRNLLESTINFINIPSMYYGSTIKKGTVELNYYIEGTRVATCEDLKHNGELIGTYGATSGSIVGLVMYDEGILMLTSSVSLESNSIQYNPGTPSDGSWLTYGTTLNDGILKSPSLASASYDLNFHGTNYLNTMTMFAHAKKGHLNHSNNPTYRDLNQEKINVTGSGQRFIEGSTEIANIVSGSYVSASFDKTTYISKVHIYDEDGNLIAITSMASPIKKTLEDEFTFKMKLDL